MKIKPIRLTLLTMAVCAMNTGGVAQTWEQTNGPFGGDVQCIAIDTSGNIYAGTRAAGVFRSTDNGTTWGAANNGIGTMFISAMVVAPDQHVFVGTTDGGIYRSTDHGSSWQAINTGLLSLGVTCLEANSSGDLFAGTNSGVHRSLDDGDTWVWANTGLTCNAVDLAVNAGDTLFACGDFPLGCGVFMSTDNGNNWVNLTQGAFTCIEVNSSGHIFTGTEGVGIRRSTDIGATWELLSSGPIAYIACILVDATDHLLVGSTASGLSRSLDNGDTWAPVNNGLTIHYVQSLALNTNNDLLVGTRFGGIFRSTDGALSWDQSNEGLLAANVQSILATPANDYFAGTLGSGVFRSTDEGATWVSVNSGLSGKFVQALVVNSSGDLFAGCADYYDGSGGIYRSTDDGASWTLLTDSTLGVQCLSIASSGIILAGTYLDGVLRSSDNGDTWSPVSNGLNGGNYTSMTIDPLNNVYIGGGFGVFRSVDEGINWTLQDDEMLPYHAVFALASGPSNVLFASTGYMGYYLFRSFDQADTWAELNPGFAFPPANALYCDLLPGLVLAGTPGGAYITGNNGIDWWEASDGLTCRDVRAFALDESGRLLAGTRGGGVFRAQLPVSIAQQEPFIEHLDQNIPNPCSTTTTITYHLTNPSSVSLRVFDVQGREVMAHRENTQGPGNGSIDLDVSALEPGPYFYNILLGDRMLTKRMIVSR